MHEIHKPSPEPKKRSGDRSRNSLSTSDGTRHLSRMPLMAWIGLGWAALIDYPASISLGPISVSGITTLILAASVLLLAPAYLPSPYPRTDSGARHGGVPLPLLLFLAWAIVTLSIHPNADGAQNVAVYVAFAGAIFATSRGSTAVTPPLVRRRFVVLSWIVAAVAIAGSLRPEFAVYQDRSFALVALLLLAVAITDRPTRRFARLLPYLLVLAITLSLSRTALVIAIAMIPFVVFRGQGRAKAAKGALFYGLVIVGAWLLYQTYQPLRERFTTGDNYQIGGISLNTSGRSAIWEMTLVNIKHGDPLLGQGPGSATRFLTSVFPNISHPHNDYLRLWHDFGLVGLALFVTGYSIVFMRALRYARLSTGRDRAVHVTASLAMVAVALAALTDNVFVYVFVMVPLGVLVGLSAALRPASGWRYGDVRRLNA